MTSEDRKQQRRARKKKQARGAKIILCALIVMVVAVSLRSYDLHQKKSENAARIQELDAEIASEEAREKEIDAYSELVKSDEFTEQVARDRLGLVYPDETLLVPKE